ncbi:MAG: DnaJ domain-containing protein, partial [Pseudomonadota bacterium]
KQSYRDPFDIFDGKDGAPAQEAAPDRKVSRLQSRAFQSLSLSASAGAEEIKHRYKQLVKRFHPDANGGDRSAEEKLQDVIKAYEILKRAGYC